MAAPMKAQSRGAMQPPRHAIATQTQINELDKRVTQVHRANADSRGLESIPEFGVILSTAAVATMTDPKAFRTGREFATGSDLCRGRTPPAARSASARFRSRAIAICGGYSSSVQYPLSEPHARGQDKFPWVTEMLSQYKPSVRCHLWPRLCENSETASTMRMVFLSTIKVARS